MERTMEHGLFEAADFMPHGMCLLWRPGLMALHVVSDAVIALSYFALSAALAYFVSHRKGLSLRHHAVAILFALFIGLCGLTHVMSILVLWQPYYTAEGVLKAITAVVSLATALSAPLLIPELLKIPSPSALQVEVEAHKKTLNDLDLARSALTEKVEETESDLRETSRRFEVALNASPISVYEQDADLIFTWVYNPPFGLDAKALVGRSEMDVFTLEDAEAVGALKQSALKSGESRRTEVQVTVGERQGWFDLRVEPLKMRDGRMGLAGTITDVSAVKAQERHLKLVMRELNHRSKNLLTIVLGIARQTARGLDVPAEFAVRLQERLSSLASAHDVLANQDWRGAELEAIIRGQLESHLQAFGSRITLDGGACTVPADSAHYVGMALHELISNAVRYGALAGEGGTIAVSWRTTERGADEWLDLEWRESGGGAVTEPARLGFGATILTSLAPSALGGKADLQFDAGGLSWILSAPLVKAP
jgi:two-component sensor histidine kinase